MLACALVLCSACGEETTEPAETTAAETDEAAATEDVAAPEIPPPTAAQSLMHGHYQRASEAREALIRGDIEAAREDMQWLATHEEGDSLPAALQPRLTTMQTEAATFAEATTLTEAGQALARTLVRCGECHEASDGGFHVALPPVPEGDSTAVHMQRHRWAATRMWEGLVTGDVDQYTAGTDVLRESALHEDDMPGAEGETGERVTALAQHVHDLGREAGEAEDMGERASVYGRYLATCAACHRLLGAGPATPPEPTTDL